MFKDIVNVIGSKLQPIITITNVLCIINKINTIIVLQGSTYWRN
jgi:hypothetical protein